MFTSVDVNTFNNNFLATVDRLWEILKILNFIGAQLPPAGGEMHPGLRVGKRPFIIVRMKTTITFISA